MAYAGGPLETTTSLQTIATNATLVRTEFDSGTFVEALRKKLIVVPMGRRNDIPRQSGVVMRWQYMSNPSAATTALTEGMDPTDSSDIDATAVTATIATYGDFFELSDIFEIATISGTRQEFVKAAGYQAALTLDTLCLVGTGSLADATSTNDAGTAIKATDLNAAARYLSGNNVDDHPMAGPGRWIGIFSSEAIHDLVNEGIPTYYQAKPGAFNNDLQNVDSGNKVLHDVSLKMSTNITAVSSNDVNYVMGKDAFGVTSLASNILKPEVMIVPASPSLASPLGMRSTIGWKARFARQIIDNNRLKEILSDVS